MTRTLFALTTLAALPHLVPAAPQDMGDPWVPPQVGELAPPLGAVDYWQRGPDHAEDLEDLRGHVVIVSSYFHACDP